MQPKVKKEDIKRLSFYSSVVYYLTWAAFLYDIMIAIVGHIMWWMLSDTTASAAGTGIFFRGRMLTEHST
jgi:hypothetical protein